MFEYLDVTDDPDAPARARISDASVAAAHALGFTDLGWIAAISEPPSATALISRVMRSKEGTTLLTLTRADQDYLSLKTVFDDGSILGTEQRPRGLRARVSARGVTVAPRHRYELSIVDAGDLATLLIAHDERVREIAKTERAPIDADLYTHVAIRKRYRQLGDRLHDAQLAFANRVSEIVFYVVLASGVAASAALVASIGFGRLGVHAAVPALGGLLVAAALGATAFRVALVWVWPFLKRDIDAPPPPTREELLALADDLRSGNLPSPQRRNPTEGRADKASVLPPETIARLRRRDLVVSIANVLLLPVVGLGMVRLLGKPGSAAAVGTVLCIDAVILFLRNRHRVELLRARFIPELVAAEALAGVTMVPPSWVRWVLLVIGFVALTVARGSILHGSPPVERWDYLQWGVIAMLFVWSAWRGVRRRHKRLVDS